ncbi:MAG: DUF885 domain-containing protein [Chitinispirillaceae bacterium]|nr:DUF885 domain-containing protein [Chitinispirillaceae bacterium]
MPTIAEQQFHTDAEKAIDDILRFSPTTATSLGDHRFDALLGDFSGETLERERNRFGNWLTHFQGFNADDWSIDNRIDRILIIQLFKNFIRSHDTLRWMSRHPGVASDECLIGVYELIMRDFAPLPQRMKSVLGRLYEVPRVLAESRELIIPAEVPGVWAEVAVESIRQGIGLFTGLVPKLAETVPELKDAVSEASCSAAASLNAYADWIEHDVLPHAQGDFAVGKTSFDEILHEDHMVAYDADELLATGWRLIDETEERMKATAAQIDPDKTIKELLDESRKDHPAAEELLDFYRRTMMEARQFVIEHEIVSIPVDERIRIEPTPQFQRATTPYAAYDPPGFLDTVQEGIFYVTPVENGADAETTERKLRSHPRADIPMTALHEAYPGHHLQLVIANRVGSKARKVGGVLSTLFIEGWAFYCEELMEQLGFVNQPIQKLARLQAQLWRAVRIVVDASLHTRGMSIGEAVNLLVQRAGLEPADANAEVRRYTMSPTQPQSYLMGKLQILEIVQEYRKRHPHAAMRRMHDDILDCGSLPPRLMRLRLFGKE